MKTKTTYILKLNGVEIECHDDKKMAFKSKYDHENQNPFAHWKEDGTIGKGYAVYRRTETLIFQ